MRDTFENQLCYQVFRFLFDLHFWSDTCICRVYMTHTNPMGKQKEKKTEGREDAMLLGITPLSHDITVTIFVP